MPPICPICKKVHCYSDGLKMHRTCRDCEGRAPSTPKPKHHDPFPVETNGPAGIIMELDFAKAAKRQPDNEAIRKYAEETITYLKAIGTGNLPAWHEVTQKRKT